MIQHYLNIALPHNPNNGGEKLQAILEELKNNPLKKEYIPGTGLIINKIKNPRVVIVSHMDLISIFNEGFMNGYTAGKKTINNERYMIGALDNTITNAALLKLIKENPKEDIVYFFSEFEERGMIGISSFMDMFPEYKNAFFINLDVTNDGVGSFCSVEYDDYQENKAKVAMECLHGLDDRPPHLQTIRFCDDMDAILAKGGHGFSYCLPTEGIIHSYKNKTLIRNLEPYYQGLKNLSEIMSL